ncbi:MAG: regulatory iron-sulfur-containing complex subunit RicT [Deinococcaceae bacterium]
MTHTQLVRFQYSPKLFPATTDHIFPVDSVVVVRGRRGTELARIRSEGKLAGDAVPQEVILRAATPEDVAESERLHRDAQDLKWFLRARVRSRKLPVKIVAVEPSLDATLLTVSYSAEHRIDLKGLAADLRSKTKSKVSFCAVGPREQTQFFGALGACGRESCSSNHLQEFAPVSIKMARDQQLPLNPDKLSGPCGRLLCCLQYEHDLYKELLKDLPRKGTKACHTVSGVIGKIVKLHPLKGTAELQTEGGIVELRADELERLSDETQASRR